MSETDQATLKELEAFLSTDEGRNIVRKALHDADALAKRIKYGEAFMDRPRVPNLSISDLLNEREVLRSQLAEARAMAGQLSRNFVFDDGQSGHSKCTFCGNRLAHPIIESKHHPECPVFKVRSWE